VNVWNDDLVEELLEALDRGTVDLKELLGATLGVHKVLGYGLC
tara:strand:- start:17503 stop:17631 length:129 start_codon:yes stop_codon:yes gene_type:complete